MMLYDVFVCHASEDKETFVRPLANALRARHVHVWYDEFTLTLGDSIRRAIDHGLKHSRYGIVVLSKAFFAKGWPQYELDGLAEREVKDRDKVILPIWHGVSHDEVASYSLPLAGRRAVSSEDLNRVVDEVLRVIQPEGSPLAIARDTVIRWGVEPPVVTDRQWLRVVEAANRLPGWGAQIAPEATWFIWSFPLPERSDVASKWGERLAWAFMQLSWTEAAEAEDIGPMTPPEKVHSFIQAWPGLLETCAVYPELLVEYAPQLSLRGFEGPLATEIERAYRANLRKHKGHSRRCDEEWALRHRTFGGHDLGTVTNAYFAGDLFGPQVSAYEHCDHLFWLLSKSSRWLPPRAHTALTEGMLDWHAWLWSSKRGRDWETAGALAQAVYECAQSERGTLVWSEAMRDDVLNQAKQTRVSLKLEETPEGLVDLFCARRFAEERVMRDRELRTRQKARE